LKDELRVRDGSQDLRRESDKCLGVKNSLICNKLIHETVFGERLHLRRHVFRVTGKVPETFSLDKPSRLRRYIVLSCLLLFLTWSASSATWTDGFEDGNVADEGWKQQLPNGWATVDGGDISPSPFGSFAAGGDRRDNDAGSVDSEYSSEVASISPEEISGSVHIENLTYYWMEDSSDGGHAVKLFDASGEMIMGIGSDNPSWEFQNVVTGDAKDRIDNPGDYDEWIRTELSFDWENNEVDIFMEQQGDGFSASATKPLPPDATGFSTIEIHSYLDDSSSSGFTWFDRFKVHYTEPSPVNPFNTFERRRVLNVSSDIESSSQQVRTNIFKASDGFRGMYQADVDTVTQFNHFLQSKHEDYSKHGQDYYNDYTGNHPRSCSQVYALSDNPSTGTYTIDPDGSGGVNPFDVRCVMNGKGGWTKIQLSNVGSDHIFAFSSADKGGRGEAFAAYDHLDGSSGYSNEGNRELDYFNPATGTDFSEAQEEALQKNMKVISRQTKIVGQSSDDDGNTGNDHDVFLENVYGDEWNIQQGSVDNSNNIGWWIYHDTESGTSISSQSSINGDPAEKIPDGNYVMPDDVRGDSNSGGGASFGYEKEYALVSTKRQSSSIADGLEDHNTPIYQNHPLYQYNDLQSDNSSKYSSSEEVINKFRAGKPISKGGYDIDHICQIEKPSGEVYCTGNNNNGQLGNGNTNGFNPNPQKVQGLEDAVQVVTGEYHSCALREDGQVYCWGYGGNGQLGDEDTNSHRTPVKVEGMNSVIDITAGTRFTCAIQRNSELHNNAGQTWCWGRNNYGQLGNGNENRREYPVRVDSNQGFSRAVDVSAGEYHTCAVEEGTRRVFCWGRNYEGQLGIDQENERYDEPRQVRVGEGLVETAKVSASHRFTCALEVGGEMFCWGRDSDGNLGVEGDELDDQESGNEIYTPHLIAENQGFSRTNVFDMETTGGGDGTCALERDGDLYCWGEDRVIPNEGGDKRPPQKISITGEGLTNPLYFGGSRYAMCALDKSGGKFCWGYEDEGEFGNNDNDDNTVDTIVKADEYNLGGRMTSVSGDIKDGVHADRIIGAANLGKIKGVSMETWMKISDTTLSDLKVMSDGS
jgi:alpha-tubulin suppressor-like RCC1 family protein